VVAVSLTRDARTGVRADSGTASLGVAYGPSHTPWQTSGTVSYGANRSSDATADGRTVSINGALSYDLGRLLAAGSSLSLETGYDRHTDRVSPDGATRGAFAFLVLRLLAF
jgi:hypothetical protein